MNRRKMLAVLGVGSLVASRGLAMRPPAAAEGYLELRLTPSARAGQAPIVVEEFGADGKSVGEIRSADDRGVILFLRRTSKDPAGPKQLRLAVEDGSKLESVLTGVRACRAGGFAQLKYYGCVPPGCGVLSGAVTSMPRHTGTVFNCEELEKILCENSTKC
jgi:hypothetical protein